MEGDEAVILTIANLIQQARPHTASSSLNSSPSLSASIPHKDFDANRRHTRFSQNRSPNVLKPLNYRAELVGTLTLPSYVSGHLIIECSCFQFSDDSSSVCCDILDFDPKMIGRSIRVLSWNFIPSRSPGGKDGFLEILTWDFLQSSSGSICSFFGFSLFCLCFGACDSKEIPKGKYLVFGVINSVSPVYIVPCATELSCSRDISGFLVSVFVCECELCCSKFMMPGFSCLREESVNCHRFTKRKIIYFCGLSSSWHPVISRLIGDVVLIRNLKKKIVFVGKEESELMYLATDEASLHVPRLFKKRSCSRNNDVIGKGEYGSYTGIITGVYLQGMVVELDQDVMLLLTDQQLTVPHSLRVGAIVTLENIHFVDPKFSWGKMLILGACCRSSVIMKSFSPLEAGCYLKSYSQRRLQKFIGSLSYSTRLWALLIISCFRKKFTGILLDKEILGSKHTEGLAQKYARSHLPVSVFHVRHGVLLEFCKHDLCVVDRQSHSQLRLVLPIANLISHCEVSWKKILDDWNKSADFSGGVCQEKTMSCGNRFYAKSIRKVICTEDIGVLVIGTLKISSSTGRLQLVDTTGGIDVMIADPIAWKFDGFFEAKDFLIVTEGVPEKLDHLDLSPDQPLSCHSILSNASQARRMKLSPYLCPKPSNKNSRIRPCSLLFDHKSNLQEHESGNFHLILLTHKFPVQRKLQLGQAKLSNMFAQAIVLPWDLLFAEKNNGSDVTRLSLDQLGDSADEFTRCEKHLFRKRCKFDQSSFDSSNFNANDAGNGLLSHSTDTHSSYISFCTENCSCISDLPLEFSCLIYYRSANYHCKGTLQYTNACNKIVPCCKPQNKTILLEFSLETYCVFETLRIGGSYLVKHQDNDIICSAKKQFETRPTKVSVNSETHFQNFVFSTIDNLRSSRASTRYPFCSSKQKQFNETVYNLEKIVSCDGLTAKGRQEVEGRCPINTGTEIEIETDISIIVPANALYLFEEVLDIYDSGGANIDALNVSSGFTNTVHGLPVGNLVDLQGLVEALHDFNLNACPKKSTLALCDLPMFLQGTGSVCVHVLVDGDIARIIGNLKKQAYPIGLGRDTYATFHRVLVLSGQNQYMMTPVSFITINYVSLMNEQYSDELNHKPGNLDLPSVAIPGLIPTALISELLPLPEPKEIQFCGRVVAVYIVVLEKNRKNINLLPPSDRSVLSYVRIPFAGYVLDDGSSSCCCWADSENAATLLGLDCEEYSRATSPADMETESQTGTWLPRNLIACRVKQILKQHDRIMVKSCSPMLDSSVLDLIFSIDANTVINSSDACILRSLIGNACFSKLWTVAGNLMDSNATRQLEESLCELDMAMPRLRNVWAASVSRTNMLAEARNVMKQLS